MEIFHISFIGHRDIPCFNKVEEKLQTAMLSLLKIKQFIEFYVGNNGDFDALVTSVKGKCSNHKFSRSIKKRIATCDSL